MYEYPSNQIKCTTLLVPNSTFKSKVSVPQVLPPRKILNLVGKHLTQTDPFSGRSYLPEVKWDTFPYLRTLASDIFPYRTDFCCSRAFPLWGARKALVRVNIPLPSLLVFLNVRLPKSTFQVSLSQFRCLGEIPDRTSLFGTEKCSIPKSVSMDK